ncbi:hypothetical protein X727_07590 [Mesorhizobium sp. L103C119B0]|nr:hypothetical protein X727_07590 [Mesorhizobium sp. L103C119B0]
MTRGDPIAASDLADQLTTAAEKPGIPADQINGEIESVFELLLEVMRRESCARNQPGGFSGAVPVLSRSSG